MQGKSEQTGTGFGSLHISGEIQIISPSWSSSPSSPPRSGWPAGITKGLGKTVPWGMITSPGSFLSAGYVLPSLPVMGWLGTKPAGSSMSLGVATPEGISMGLPMLPPVPQHVDVMRRKKLQTVHCQRPGPFGEFWSPSYGSGGISVATGLLKVSVDLAGTVV